MNELYRVWRTLDLDSPLFAKNLERRLHIYFESTTEYITDTLEHLILFFLVYFATCVLLYVFIVAWKTFPYTKSINCKRVLFITSHPDDEVMFFGPTILHLMKQPDVQVYLICLSTGVLISLSLSLSHTHRSILLNDKHKCCFQAKTMEWERCVKTNCTRVAKF